jgi:uncharacterized pyridoxamine 5'-phosphate oxidase family protein
MYPEFEQAIYNYPDRRQDHMKEIVEFLSKNMPFYVATVDGDAPRARPFGFVMEHEGKLYFAMNNKKEVYRQLVANPNIEIVATAADMNWARISGKAVFDGSMAAKERAFEVMPAFKDMYQSPDNPIFEVFYLTGAKAEYYGMAGVTKTVEL